MHTSQNVGLQTLCACSVWKTRTCSRPRPLLLRSLMYKQPYLRALCGSKKYPYLYGWRLDLYPTPILVEFPVQLYTFTLKIWLLGPLPHWNLKWPSFLWVWIFFAWSLTLQWFLFSKPITVSSHPRPPFTTNALVHVHELCDWEQEFCPGTTNGDSPFLTNTASLLMSFQWKKIMTRKTGYRIIK